MKALTLLVVASSALLTSQKAVTNVTTISSTSTDKSTTVNAVTINLDGNEDHKQNTLEQGNQEHLSATTGKVPVIKTLIDRVSKAKETKLGSLITKLHRAHKNKTVEDIKLANLVRNRDEEKMEEIITLSLETQETISKYFDDISENILKQLYAVFINEESTPNDMKMVLDKLIAILNASQKSQFEEILSSMESVVALRKKLFNEVSEKAKEAIKKADASKMDEISTLMKLDYTTRVEVISYYKKIADIKNALMRKLRHLRQDVLQSKELNESDEGMKKDRKIHALITPITSLEHEKNVTIETKEHGNEEKTKETKKLIVNDAKERKNEENPIDKNMQKKTL